MSSGVIRWGWLAAMLGGVPGIVPTPIPSYLWAIYSRDYLYYGRAYLLVLPDVNGP